MKCTHSGSVMVEGYTENGRVAGSRLTGVTVLCPCMSKTIYPLLKGAQWLSGRVLESRPRGPRFEPHQCHCVVVLEQDTFILA